MGIQLDMVPRRRMSIYGKYCPVSHIESHVLVDGTLNFTSYLITLGSLDFVTTYNGQVFLFADEPCMQKFIRDPNQYCTPNLRLSKLKICIPGPTNNGPSFFSQTVAKVFGLSLVNVDDLLTNLFDPNYSSENVDKIRQSPLYNQVIFLVWLFTEVLDSFVTKTRKALDT